MTGLQQDVPNPVMAGDHIPTILAGDCMVAKVIASTARPGHSAHWEPSEVSRPSHHLMATWKTGGIHVKPQVAQQKATMQHGGKKLTKEVPCLPQKKHLTVS